MFKKHLPLLVVGRCGVSNFLWLTGCFAVQGPGLNVDWNDLLGQGMELKILEADEEKDRLVLSNRKSNFATRRQLNVSLLNSTSLLLGCHHENGLCLIDFAYLCPEI